MWLRVRLWVCLGVCLRVCLRVRVRLGMCLRVRLAVRHPLLWLMLRLRKCLCVRLCSSRVLLLMRHRNRRASEAIGATARDRHGQRGRCLGDGSGVDRGRRRRVGDLHGAGADVVLILGEVLRILQRLELELASDVPNLGVVLAGAPREDIHAARALVRERNATAKRRSHVLNHRLPHFELHGLAPVWDRHLQRATGLLLAPAAVRGRAAKDTSSGESIHVIRLATRSARMSVATGPSLPSLVVRPEVPVPKQVRAPAPLVVDRDKVRILELLRRGLTRQTCPLLLRVFTRVGGRFKYARMALALLLTPRRSEEFENPSKLPADELDIYTW